MSKRVDKHLTLEQLSSKIDTLNEEIKISDKLSFGAINGNNKTQKHDQVLSINRQLNQVKRSLADREKGSIDEKYLRLVKQLMAANDNDLDQVTEVIKTANQETKQRKLSQDDSQSRMQARIPDPSEPNNNFHE